MTWPSFTRAMPRDHGADPFAGPSFVLRWLGPLAVWAILFNLIGRYTWGHGRQTFVAMMVATLLLLYLRPLANLGGWARHPQFPAGRRSLHVLLLIFLVASGGQLAYEAYRGLASPPAELMDLSANTYAAGEAFLAGHNPYTSRAQLAHTIEPGPNVRISGSGVTMFGVPYHYGYPYFPALFLSYLPFRGVVDGYGAILLGNLLFLLANLAAVGLLARRLAPAGSGNLAGLVAVAAYVSVGTYGREIFEFGIIDILISTYALYGFLALSHRRYRTAGVLLGLAQACKLLPGPLLLLPVLLCVRHKKVWRHLLPAHVITCAALIGPFLLWDAEGFLSGTILFYLTHHAVGDSTSLWFFLPEAMQPALLLAGALGTVLVLLLTARRSGNAVALSLTGAFLSYLVFMACAKMTHLNYLWGVYPLGCVALAAWTGAAAAQPRSRIVPAAAPAGPAPLSPIRPAPTSLP